MKKVLGIDWGRAHIGIAISDADHRWAFPRSEVAPGKPFFDTLAVLQKEEDIGAVVVGYPLPLGKAGSVGEQQLKDVEIFAADLRIRLGVPVALMDERMSNMKAAIQQYPDAGDHERAAAMLLSEYLARAAL
ncbi:MAG: Holliday junction resolvase RuvX [Patescibacteria group bacterium]|jgi:putative transcription antitermination factor YqgF